MAKQQIEITNAEKLFILNLLKKEQIYQSNQNNPSSSSLEHCYNLNKKIRLKKWNK